MVINMYKHLQAGSRGCSIGAVSGMNPRQGVSFRNRRARRPPTLMRALLACLLVLTALPGALTAAEDPAKPNILLILADDLGYSDLGCYGGEIRTPTLDSLAANGLRFTRCYNSSRCCPSRASLLTGLYPHQAGIGRFVGGGKLPGYLGRLSDRCATMAEVLEPAGYSTYACGKWHVNDPPPTERGFREFYGFVHGYAVDSWEPRMMVRLPEGRKEREYPPDRFFATDAITDHALDFLAEARESEDPWMLYVAYQAPHFPVQAPTALSATYDKVYEQGWDKLRAERLTRMKRLGIVDPALELPPRSPIDNTRVAKRMGSMTEDGLNPAWDDLPADRRADLARRMAVYAAMVEGMDSNIGRMIDSLRKNGELENTLIIFLSDNGACAEWEPFGFDLAPTPEEKIQPGRGINGYTPGQPNRLHAGDELATMGGPGSLFSYGSAWANLSNTPLSLYKHYASEGGIRTPMILHWPARVPKGGEMRDHVVHIMDIVPSLLEVAGASYPGEWQGRSILPVEGRSLLEAIDGKAVPERPLVFEHERNAALIEGDWKIVGQKVIAKDKVLREERWSLHYLKDDPAEQRNLAAKHPERLEQMISQFEKEARRTLIVPAP
jgi:arylsulfatase A-like enzyme